LLAPFPSITARKPYHAQRQLQDAFKDYFRNHREDAPDVSRVIKDRVAVDRSFGLTSDDVAATETGFVFAATANAVPSLFWLYINILSDPSLTKDVVAEIDALINKGANDDYVLDVTKFREHCPLLVSSYQEVLRLTRDRILGTRMTIEDTLLNSTDPDTKISRTYLLKKGVMTQMTSHTIHRSAEIWGKDVDIFNGRRFYSATNDESNNSKRTTLQHDENVQKRALAPFGGGKHVCPGRYFAEAEILGTVAVLLTGFETVPDEDGVSSNILSCFCTLSSMSILSLVALYCPSIKLTERLSHEEAS
jgi:cytochrome P450